MGKLLRVLLVEDREDDALLIVESLKGGGYEVLFERVDTEEAVRTALSGEVWDIILCDYSMPRFDIGHALSVIEEFGLDIPFIIVSGQIGEETAVACMKEGAHDYVMKENLSRLVPAIEREIKEAVVRQGKKRNEEALREAEERYRSIFENAQEGIYRSTPAGRIIMANQSMANMFGYETPEELMTVVSDVASQLYVHPEERTKLTEIIEEQGSVRNYETQFYRKDGTIFWASMTMHAVRDPSGQILYYDGIDDDITGRKESAERMRKSLGATVQAIAVIVETRDPYTAGHQRKVADLARAIATEMKLPADRIDVIRMASSIHDLGKISVPAEILSTPNKLTALEFSLIKTHAQSGYDILKDIEFPGPVARIIREHHERINGAGYPQGLVGEEILLESRILAVADVVEAMASHRPYRPAIGLDAALAEIENNKGTLYDVDAVDACLRLFREKGFQLEKT